MPADGEGKIDIPCVPTGRKKQLVDLLDEFCPNLKANNPEGCQIEVKKKPKSP